MATPVIETITIKTADGERYVSFSPPKSLADIGEAELGAMIGDALAGPPGWSIMQQHQARPEAVNPDAASHQQGWFLSGPATDIFRPDKT